MVEGLEARLEGNSLTVGPGIGVTRIGRALTVEAQGLEADLGDRATLQALNRDLPRQLSTGLYALVLLHNEMGVGSAEVFPRDLGEARRSNDDSVADAVQLALVPLPIPLPHGDGLAARAILARALTAGRRFESLLPDDSLALGVLGVRQDVPVWFDPALMRNPRRPGDPLGSGQADLARHYEALFADVWAERLATGLTTPYAAREYFHLLPPAGSAPKQSFDPVNGTQSFFPEQVEVRIAPVREDERETLIRESLLLDPLDLDREEAASVMVLVSLPPADFAELGQALVHGPVLDKAAFVKAERIEQRLRVSGIEPLRLRLFARPPVHRLDSDADTWSKIWDRIGPEDLFFVRRPHSASATGISAVVLASGFGVPDIGDDEDQDKVVDALKKQLAEAQKAAKSADQARKKAETAASSARKEAEALEKQVKTGQTQLKSCQAEVKEVEARLRDCKQQGSDNVIDRDKLLGRVKDLENSNLRLKAEKKQLTTERNRAVKDLQDSLNSRGAEVIDLRKQLDREKATNRGLRQALEAAQRDGGRFRDRLTQREAELVQVRNVVKARDQQIKTKDQQIANFNQQIKARDRTIATRNQQIKTKDQQIRQRNDQIKAKNAQLKAQNTQLTQLRARGGLTQIRRPR